jgi:hypothetical protein
MNKVLGVKKKKGRGRGKETGGEGREGEERGTVRSHFSR